MVPENAEVDGLVRSAQQIMLFSWEAHGFKITKEYFYIK